MATVAAAPEAAAPEATNAPVAVGIPQIRFNDVPITTAIENLARLANINYMLDPKIGYGDNSTAHRWQHEWLFWVSVVCARRS